MYRTFNWIITILMISVFAIWLAPRVLSQDSARTGHIPEIKVNPASKARIKFEGENWDFGSIPKSATVIHEFKFKNIGTDTLVVSKVRPTCGCTLAPLSSDKIAPGQEASIRASFNTEKFNGRVTKQIYVDSSDPINPYLKITFSAIINNPLLPVQPQPTEVDFGTVKKGQKVQMKVALANSDKAPANLVVVEESSKNKIKAQIASNMIAPGQSTNLILELTPSADTGQFKESITLEAPGLTDSRITIPIKGIVQP